MPKALLKSLKTALPEMGGLLVLFSVAALSVFYFSGEREPQRQTALGLLAIFLGLSVFGQLQNWWEKRPWLQHAFMIARILVIVALMLLPPVFSFFPILFFVLSAEVPMIFPARVWRLYILAFALLTAVIAILYAEEMGTALAISLVYGGGYYFFAAFAATTARTQAAQRELEQANRRLQVYAAQVEDLTIVNERNRLAREMHDTLGHRLTVAAVHLEAAQRLIPRDPERAAAMVGTVREEVQDALGELRQTVATLRAPFEEDLSLIQALQRLTSQFQQATGIEVSLDLPTDLPDPPAPQRKAIFRAAQESLTNVQRHANAHHAWVQIQQQDGAITLCVSDNGVGFSSPQETSGFGLRGLRERAIQLGGDFSLTPRPGGGAQATFCIPLPPPEDAGSMS